MNLDHREAALSYASDGLRVGPLHKPHAGGCSCGDPECKSVGKHPLAAAIPHGKDDFTTDTKQIDRWFTRYPMANIGISPAEGMVVVDVDIRNDGHRTLLNLVKVNAPLPETLVAQTGSGGFHYWFTAPKVTVGWIGPGLDVKTSRGYLVAPPSVHESGGMYQWLTDAPIAPAPVWLRKLLAPERKVSRHIGPIRPGGDAGLVRTVAEAEDGTRNDKLWWAARKAFERGNTDLVEQIRIAAINNGLGVREVESAIRSAERRAAGGAR